MNPRSRSRSACCPSSSPGLSAAFAAGGLGSIRRAVSLVPFASACLLQSAESIPLRGAASGSLALSTAVPLQRLLTGYGATGDTQSYYSSPSDLPWRWHPGGRPLLLGPTGILNLSPSIRVPYHLRYDRQSGGCDWSADGRSVVDSPASPPPQVIRVCPTSAAGPHSCRTLVGGGFASVNFAPQWEPRGRRVAFLTQKLRTRGAPLYLGVIDGRGGIPKKLGVENVSNHSPLWSPVGGKILVHLWPEPATLDLLSPTRGLRASLGSSYHFAVIELSTGRIDRIAVPRMGEWTPELDWSPTGTHIVVAGDFGDGYGSPTSLRILRLVDHRFTRLGTIPPPVESLTEPTWSPDGRRIAFVINKRAEQRELAVIDVSSGKHRIIQRGYIYGKPFWSPDGRLLAAEVTRLTGGHWHGLLVFRVRDGSVVERGELKVKL